MLIFCPKPRSHLLVSSYEFLRVILSWKVPKNGSLLQIHNASFLSHHKSSLLVSSYDFLGVIPHFMLHCHIQVKQIRRCLLGFMTSSAACCVLFCKQTHLKYKAHVLGKLFREKIFELRWLTSKIRAKSIQVYHQRTQEHLPSRCCCPEARFSRKIWQ